MSLAGGWGNAAWLTGKGQEESLKSNDHSLHLDRGLGYTNVCTCQMQQIMLGFVYCDVCKLYLERKKQ